MGSHEALTSRATAPNERLYACGFFVIHTLRVIGNGESLSCVTNDQTAKVRSETLDLIRDNLPYAEFVSKMMCFNIYVSLRLLRQLKPKPAVPLNDIEMSDPAQHQTLCQKLDRT
jgi:hypothetical protein